MDEITKETETENTNTEETPINPDETGVENPTNPEETETTPTNPDETEGEGKEPEPTEPTDPDETETEGGETKPTEPEETEKPTEPDTPTEPVEPPTDEEEQPETVLNTWQEKVAHVFAEDGVIDVIPAEKQADDRVSFKTGYTDRYHKDLAKDSEGNKVTPYGLEHGEFNALFRLVTSAVKELQETLPTYIDDKQRLDISKIIETNTAFDALQEVLCINKETGLASRITVEDIIQNLHPDINLSDDNISVSEITEQAMDNFLTIDGNNVKIANKLIQECIEQIDLSKENVLVSNKTTHTAVTTLLVTSEDGTISETDQITQEHINEINLSKSNIVIEHGHTSASTTLKPLLVDEHGNIKSEDTINIGTVEGDIYAKGLKTTVMTELEYPNGIDDLRVTGLYSLCSMDEYKDILNNELGLERTYYIIAVLRDIVEKCGFDLEYFEKQVETNSWMYIPEIMYNDNYSVKVVGQSLQETDNTTVIQEFRYNGIPVGYRTGTMTLDGVEFEEVKPVSNLYLLPKNEDKSKKMKKIVGYDEDNKLFVDKFEIEIVKDIKVESYEQIKTLENGIYTFTLEGARDISRNVMSYFQENGIEKYNVLKEKLYFIAIAENEDDIQAENQDNINACLNNLILFKKDNSFNILSGKMTLLSSLVNNLEDLKFYLMNNISTDEIINIKVAFSEDESFMFIYNEVSNALPTKYDVLSPRLDTHENQLKPNMLGFKDSWNVLDNKYINYEDMINDIKSNTTAKYLMDSKLMNLDYVRQYGLSCATNHKNGWYRGSREFYTALKEYVNNLENIDETMLGYFNYIVDSLLLEEFDDTFYDYNASFYLTNGYIKNLEENSNTQSFYSIDIVIKNNYNTSNLINVDCDIEPTEYVSILKCMYCNNEFICEIKEYQAPITKFEGYMTSLPSHILGYDSPSNTSQIENIKKFPTQVLTNNFVDKETWDLVVNHVRDNNYNLQPTSIDLNRLGAYPNLGGIIDFVYAGENVDYTSSIREDARGEINFLANKVKINGNSIDIDSYAKNVSGYIKCSASTDGDLFINYCSVGQVLYTSNNNLNFIIPDGKVFLLEADYLQVSVNNDFSGSMTVVVNVNLFTFKKVVSGGENLANLEIGNKTKNIRLQRIS